MCSNWQVHVYILQVENINFAYFLFAGLFGDERFNQFLQVLLKVHPFPAVSMILGPTERPSQEAAFLPVIFLLDERGGYPGRKKG